MEEVYEYVRTSGDANDTKKDGSDKTFEGPFPSIEEVFLGPMFAGKTTGLISWLDVKRYAGYDCALVIFEDDKRYDGCGTHSGLTVKPEERTAEKGGLKIYEMKALDHNKITEVVVAINEGQFFPDIATGCLKLVEQGKCVAVAALDMTYERKPFENIATLSAITDGNIVKLKAVCMRCRKRKAPYSCRIVPNKDVFLIGTKKEYLATCRACWTPAPSSV